MLGECPALASRRREHDVAVEDRAGRVGDRLVHVVALDQHGVEPGDAAAARRCPARSSSRGQQREHATAGSRGWPAARRRTGRPRAGPSRTRVRLSIIRTTSRPWSRNHSAMRVAVNAARSADQRGLVGGGHDDDRAGQALGPEVVLDELAHLAAAFADQREHRHVGARCPARSSTAASTCRRRSRRRCRGAARGRTARACRGPARRAGAGGRSPCAASGWGGGAVDADPAERRRGRAAVDRAAEAVEDAAEQPGADGDGQAAAGRGSR